MRNGIRRLGLFGLAGVGLITLASKSLEFVPNDFREKNGTLSSGMKYTFRKASHNTPNGGASKYVMGFGDSVVVEDAFVDGYICPSEVEISGVRVVTTEQSKRGTVGVVDDSLREEAIRRVAEVYTQQGIDVEVRDSV